MLRNTRWFFSSIVRIFQGRPRFWFPFRSLILFLTISSIFACIGLLHFLVELIYIRRFRNLKHLHLISGGWVGGSQGINACPPRKKTSRRPWLFGTLPLVTHILGYSPFSNFMGYYPCLLMLSVIPFRRMLSGTLSFVILSGILSNLPFEIIFTHTYSTHDGYKNDMALSLTGSLIHQSPSSCCLGYSPFVVQFLRYSPRIQSIALLKEWTGNLLHLAVFIRHTVSVSLSSSCS